MPKKNNRVGLIKQGAWLKDKPIWDQTLLNKLMTR